MPPLCKVPTCGEIIGRLRRAHPRILLTGTEARRVSELVRTDGKAKAWFARLSSGARKILSQEPLRYEIPDGLRLLSVSRGVQERVYALALVHLLTRDARYAERAWLELESAANYRDWNPRHFLDTAEMAHAFAVGYDWLYGEFDGGQRKVLLDAMVEKGLGPAIECYDGKSGFGWWVKSRHNWNQVCNGGIGICALAVADERPRMASEVIQSALRSIRGAMLGYAPDGGWAEGPGYWSYATFYSVAFIEALSTALGTDFGLSGFAGFSETGSFPIYLTGPTGLLFNFADCGEKLGNAPQMLWLARKFSRANYAQYEMRVPKPHPLDILWLRGRPKKPEVDPPLDKYYRNVEVVTMRSAWGKKDALFVAFKAGDNEANHSNLDCGTFVLDASGCRWAIDLGPDDYNLPGYFGADRWKYYRMRSEGHNVLVINPGKGADQKPDAKTRIVRFESGPENAFAMADLTPAYEDSARSVLRGVAMLGRRKILVQDEVETKRPSSVWWFMHSRARIELDRDGRVATLVQSGKHLRARIVSPEGARFEVMEAAPLPTSPNPEGQESNEGVRKLAIRLKDVSGARIAVLLAPSKGRGETQVGLERAFRGRLEEWRSAMA